MSRVRFEAHLGAAEAQLRAAMAEDGLHCAFERISWTGLVMRFRGSKDRKGQASGWLKAGMYPDSGGFFASFGDYATGVSRKWQYEEGT